MPTHVNGISADQKIDSLAVNGLSGVDNSLSYKVHEIEKHFHNSPQCYGNTAGNLARGVLTPFQVVAGASGVLGTELQIHDGTVIESGSTTKKFDFNLIYITNVQTADVTYFFEIWAGTSTFAAATKISESYFKFSATNNDTWPIYIMSSRVTCNNKIWCRASCSNVATRTIDFLIGVHTYVA